MYSNTAALEVTLRKNFSSGCIIWKLYHAVKLHGNHPSHSTKMMHNPIFVNLNHRLTLTNSH